MRPSNPELQHTPALKAKTPAQPGREPRSVINAAPLVVREAQAGLSPVAALLLFSLPELTPQQAHLAQRVGQVLLSTNDMADAHEGVIDGHAEVVDRQAIAAQDHKIAQRVGVPGDLRSSTRASHYFTPCLQSRACNCDLSIC